MSPHIVCTDSVRTNQVLAFLHPFSICSTPPSSRLALNQALELLAAGGADALVVAKLDRATRSVADLCYLLDLADKGFGAP